MRTSDEITFGQLVGSYRTLRAKLSQDAFADLIGISKGCFRKWEIDRSKPSAQHLQKLLEIFLDLGLFTARKEEEEARAIWQASKVNVVFGEVWTNALVNTREHRSGKMGQVDAALPQTFEMLAPAEIGRDSRKIEQEEKVTLSAPSETDQDTSQLDTPPSDRDFMRNRRQILHHLLAIGSTALVLSPGAVLSSDGSEQINLSVLEEFEHITASYWKIRANTSINVLENIAVHFHTVVNLLQRALPRETALRLYTLSGETAQLLGQTLFDLQEYTLAWSYYMFSLKAAQSASNHDLWAAGIGRMILLLIYWETSQNALPLLQEVHQLNIQSSRIVCWLAAVEAEVYAHVGDAESCDAALKKAKDILKNEPLGEDRYATGFSASRLDGYEGACFVRLHQPSRALPALERALSLLDRQAIRQQSTLLTDMAIAYAQQGNIQKACQLAIQALSITEQTRSRSVLERVRRACSEMKAGKEADEVKNLEQQLNKTSLLIAV